jgi:hypothetical protein
MVARQLSIFLAKDQIAFGQSRASCPESFGEIDGLISVGRVSERLGGCSGSFQLAAILHREFNGLDCLGNNQSSNGHRREIGQSIAPR